MSNKLIRYFPETDMRNGHRGLMKIALAKKINVKTLKHGEFVVFTNKKMNKLKMFGVGGNFIAYLSLPKERSIDKEAIQYLPATMNGGQLDYSKAIERRIDRQVSTRRNT